MKHSSEKPLAPANYSRCFNNQCPKADNCLHRLAALRDTPEYPSIRIINPLCIPEDSSQCAYFQSTQRYMSHGESATCSMKFPTRISNL